MGCGLGQELVPKKFGEGGGDASEDAEEVSFGGMDGVCGGIVAMHTGFGTGFVVKDLVFNDVDVFLELGHDAVVGCDVVAIMTGLELFDEDDIAIAVVSEKDVLVVAAGADVEVAHVIGRELADVLYPNLKFIRLGVGKRAGDVVEGCTGIKLIVGFRPGGLNTLAGLYKMAFDDFFT